MGSSVTLYKHREVYIRISISLEKRVHPNLSEDGMNLLVVSLGEKNAKDYCEVEMLNEKTENARVAAGAAINALKGKII